MFLKKWGNSCPNWRQLISEEGLFSIELVAVYTKLHDPAMGRVSTVLNLELCKTDMLTFVYTTLRTTM